MHTAKIRFSFAHKGPEAAVEAALDLLSVWYKNGQIATDEWPAIAEGYQMTFVVSLPDADSLESAHNNEYAAKELAALHEHGLSTPTIEVLGKDPGTLDPCQCARSSSYILFTHFLTSESPIRCGDCFQPVPFYRLRAEDHGEYLYIRHWTANYQACDTLQMNCNVGEAFGEGQLLAHDSDLSLEGRDICRTITDGAGVPSYYYLHKARGETEEAERNRRCPNCGGAWLLPVQWHGHFEFRCDHCRLLSNIACDLEG